jgi:hypothetical protein
VQIAGIQEFYKSKTKGVSVDGNSKWFFRWVRILVVGRLEDLDQADWTNGQMIC